MKLISKSLFCSRIVVFPWNSCLLWCIAMTSSPGTENITVITSKLQEKLSSIKRWIFTGQKEDDINVIDLIFWKQNYETFWLSKKVVFVSEIPNTSPPPSPFLDAGTPPATASSGPQECRLCAQESNQTIGIFSKEGCERGLPEKTRLCLPILVRDQRLHYFLLSFFFIILVNP